ncbi:hypothetical protein ACVHNB_35985 [Streptomyces sp. YJ-C3]
MAGQKKTSFDGMTHEQMLAWLDNADADTVQAAADKLAAAAKEIHSIADELKVRPQWVKWKGEGADSFRQWAGKLANATVALGDYSQDSSKWLGHAAVAIGKAKTSVPRDKNVDANIDAARSAHNDPDAQSVLSKNMAVRQQTADEMVKLGQAYSLSSSQMAAARKPDLLKFPPPPVDIQDPNGRDVYDSEDLGTGPSGGTGRTSIGGVGSGRVTVPEGAATGRGSSPSGGEAVRPPVAEHTGTVTPVVPEAPARMEVDSVDVLPHSPQAQSPVTPPGVTGTTGPGGVQPSPPGLIPPAYGITGGTPPSARGLGTSPGGRSTPTPLGGGGTGRPGSSTPNVVGRPTNSSPSAQGTTGTGRTAGSSTGRGPAQNGVTGGRPQPATGKPTSGVPRGTVMGAEGSGNARGTSGTRGPSGSAQGGITGRPTATGSPTRGGTSGRTSGGAAGEKGVVGGRPSQQQRANTRSFSQGGSGLVRSQGAAGGPGEDRHGTGAAGRGGAAPTGARPGSRKDDEQSERPDYVTEDEATWQPDAHRNVPPVVADETKNDER